jgi:hypothetical protein
MRNLTKEQLRELESLNKIAQWANPNFRKFMEMDGGPKCKFTDDEIQAACHKLEGLNLLYGIAA